jgi:hypothetical protein
MKISRIDVIGQNGNGGEHYDQILCGEELFVSGRADCKVACGAACPRHRGQDARPVQADGAAEVAPVGIGRAVEDEPAAAQDGARCAGSEGEGE